MQEIRGVDLMIIPAYNESKRWRKDYWSSLLSSTTNKWLFIDDGSTDATQELIQDLVEEFSNERVDVLVNGKNFGKAESIRRGFQMYTTQASSARGLVGFLDADGSFPVDEVRRFMSLSAHLLDDTSKSKPDTIWSSRVALAGRLIQRSTSRHLIGRMLHTIVATKIKNLPYDSQSGMKIFRMSTEIETVLTQPFRTRWLFELEILLRCQRSGIELALIEEPLLEWRDIGVSHIRGAEIFRVVRDLWRLFTL